MQDKWDRMEDGDEGDELEMYETLVKATRVCQICSKRGKWTREDEAVWGLSCRNSKVGAEGCERKTRSGTKLKAGMGGLHHCYEPQHIQPTVECAF